MRVLVCIKGLSGNCVMVTRWASRLEMGLRCHLTAPKMKQSKKQSAIESMTNVLVGYGVALSSQLIIFPFYDINIAIEDNIIIGVWFTLISLVRSYVIRRYFTNRGEYG